MNLKVVGIQSPAYNFCSAQQTEDQSETTPAAQDGSVRAYYREFRKVIDAADVVLEVLDARDPIGSRCYDVEQAALSAGIDKKLVLILNKIGMYIGCSCMFENRYMFLYISIFSRTSYLHCILKANQKCLFFFYIWSSLIDLVPRDIAVKWLHYLRNELPTVAFKASTQNQRHNLVRNCYFC